MRNMVSLQLLMMYLRVGLVSKNANIVMARTDLSNSNYFPLATVITRWFIHSQVKRLRAITLGCERADFGHTFGRIRILPEVDALQIA